MLNLVRGLPGTNKAGVARQLASVLERERNAAPVVLSPSGFMLGVDGAFEYQPRKETVAAEECFNTVKHFLGFSDVVVYGNFVHKEDWKMYEALANEKGHKFKLLDLFDAQSSDEELAERSNLKVPVETIKEMRSQWER